MGALLALSRDKQSKGEGDAFGVLRVFEEPLYRGGSTGNDRLFHCRFACGLPLQLSAFAFVSSLSFPQFLLFKEDVNPIGDNFLLGNRLEHVVDLQFSWPHVLLLLFEFLVEL